jgi:type VI secretion system protein ImpG
MSDRDARYRAYLEQLHSLDEFRHAHGELNPHAAVDGEDPAVKRIIEALAYFTVGTQLAAQNTMRASLERLLGGYFDFILSPMPAMVTLQLAQTERLIETMTVPEATPVALTAPDGAVGEFRTLHDLPVVHARLERVELLVLEDRFRLLVPIRAQFPVRGLPGALPLHVHYLDRYVASLRLTHNLRRHLRAVSAFFDERPSDGRPGAPCEIAFGPVTSSATVCGNPLERVRLLLHYPELELSLQVQVPQAPRPWTRLVLAFDLDSGWPDSRAAVNDPFVLHTVPAVNLKRAPAAAVVFDGTRLVHPILPNEVDRDRELATVAGVYEIADQHDARVPVPSAGLPGSSEGYEIERVDTPAGIRHRLVLRFRNAFDRPRKIVAEIDWYQPRFSAHAVGPVKASFTDRHVEGQLRVLGTVREHAESPLAQLSSALLELLAMRMKPTLRKDELLALLRLLGVDERSPFHPALDRIRELTVDTRPDLGAVNARYRYRLRLDPIAPADEAITWTLVERIRELLDAWSGGDAVAVEVEVDRD